MGNFKCNLEIVFNNDVNERQAVLMSQMPTSLNVILVNVISQLILSHIGSSKKFGQICWFIGKFNYVKSYTLLIVIRYGRVQSNHFKRSLLYHIIILVETLKSNFVCLNWQNNQLKNIFSASKFILR